MEGKTKSKYLNKEFITNLGDKYNVIEYINCENIKIEFNNGYVCNTTSGCIIQGNIKNLLKPSIYNKGFIGVGEYKISNNSKSELAYNKWVGMLARCYNPNYHINHPTYKNCEVCEEWLNYQNFAKWFEDNYIEGFHLDKDLLVKDNKIYSSETCCFIPNEINILFIKPKINKYNLPTGVTKVYNKYVARINYFDKTLHLGSFSNVEDALLKYNTIKTEHNINTVNKYKDILNPKIYIKLLENLNK